MMRTYKFLPLLKFFGKQTGVTFIMLSTLFYSFGGIDLYLGLTTPFAPKVVGAAYTGKQLRTIEYILADGSENTPRGNGALSYAGASWNQVKATAGQKNIIIEGSGIRVVNAYLDASFIASTTGNLTGLDIFFTAQYSALAGSDVRVHELAANTPFINSGLSGYVRGSHDVTAFFATTTDANWTSGVGVTAGASTTFSVVAGSARTLTTIKLVLTYEQNFSSSVHNEIKTVRLPLDSTNGSDSGTRQAQCAAAATCGFTYDTNSLPDAALDADIIDVYFEIHAMVDSAVSSTIQPQISGGTLGPLYTWGEATANHTAVNVTFRPTVGAPDFTRNTAQTLNIINGAVGLNLLGGELVVTYRYSTGASAQTETVRYFVDQDTTNPATATSTFATATVAISNSGKSIKNIWYRIQTAPIAAANIGIGSAVGTATKKFKTYAVTGTNPRSGDSPTIIHDLSADIGNFWNTSVPLGGESRASVSNAPVGLEAFVTFTWDGNPSSDVTKSVTFSGAQQGVSATALQWNNRSVELELPETVSKTYRSAYLLTNYNHSNAGTITATGNLTIGVNGSTTVITENGDNEAFNTRYFHKIASTTLSNGDTIAWTSRAIEINQTKSVANTAMFSNEVVVTYDAALGGNDSTPNPKQLRTVEYVLGGESENTMRASGVRSYAGASWASSKVGAGTKSIVLNGSNIRVVNAYLEFSFIVASSSNLTGIDVYLDAEGSSSAGSDVPVAEASGVSIYSTTGLTGYIRGNHDVTALFDRQSDAQWSSGVGVVASASSTLALGNRTLSTMRLVITYESDYSLVAHTETKTVRFPLDSTAGTDTGTKQTACAISAVCGFSYTANIPDAAADADILDVYFDMHAEVNSALAGSFDFQITSMPFASQAYAWVETNTDDNTVNVIYRPAVSGTAFQRNTAQTLNINNGPVALSALGGEVVVTYRYSTGSSAQTETVRYFVDQRATAPGTTRNSFATITPTISNGTLSVKNIWYKVHVAPVAATNMTVFGRVGTTTEKSKVFAFAATNPRAGDTPTVIYDMSADIGNFWTSTTTLAGAIQFSAANSGTPPAVEAYVTYTWNGSLGGTTTRSVMFSGAQQGVTNLIGAWNNSAVRIELPETVTKTYRSAYLETNHLHSNAATTITVGTLTFAENGVTSTVAENGDTEAYNAVYFNQVASSTLSTADTIAWTKRSLEVNNTRNVANYSYWSNTLVVTYDANQEYKFPTFTQNSYRFYVDNGAVTPDPAWPSGSGSPLSENAEITAADSPPGNGANLRLRMSLTVATTTMLASSTQFKLQFGKRVSTCGAVASWTDIGAPGSGTQWRGYNATPVDGANLSLNPPTGGDLLLSVSDRAGLYSESNPTLVNPFATVVGEDVEYDWNIQNNNAATDTPYCFRMVKGDDTVLNDYSASYPTAYTAGYTAESKNWRWYDDENNETPTAPLAIENTAPTNIVTENKLKLRVTLNETGGSNGVNQKFMLQYSEWGDFSRGVTDLVGTSTCTINSIWCYATSTVGDDVPVSTLLLTDSVEKGRHYEEATTTSSSGPLASTATEYEFSIKHAGARVNTTYFFRVWDVNHARVVPLGSGESYPSLSTQGGTLSFTVSGLASTTVVGDITTDVDTTATEVPFGTVAVGFTSVTAAQRLSISTNATEGYQVFVKSNDNLVNTFGDIIPDVSGTNAVPSAWATGCLSSASGCYGYHTTDSTLSGNPIRFLVDDTYAKFSSTTLEEIMYNSGPVTADTADVVFRLEAHITQPAGAYTTSAQYIVVPIF